MAHAKPPLVEAHLGNLGIRSGQQIQRFLDRFAIALTLGLSLGIEATPLECVGLAGYIPELLFWMIFPLVISVFIVLLVLLSAAWTNHLKTGSGSRTGE